MNLSNVKINEILNFSELKKLFKHFSVISEMDVTLYDENGDEKLSYRREECICNKVKDIKCREAIKYSASKAKELDAPYIFETPCGLIMCIFPVIFDVELIGSIACGPVLLWEKDDFARTEFKENIKKLNINIDETQMKIEDIKSLNCEKMTSSAQMLSVLVTYMVTEEKKYLEQRLEIKRLNSERKTAIATINLAENYNKFLKYPLELEKELIAYVHLGDKPKAKKIINSFLNEIFSYASGDLDIIKAKLYEFTAFLSRSAVEAGAPLKDLTTIIKKSSKLLLDNIDFQDICFTTIEILDDFIDVVYQSRSKKSTSQHLAKAIEYLNLHYAEDISLDSLSKAVFVSGYYLSHLFRDEMKTTFSDYLTKIRIENSKILLRENYSIEKVSELAGFKDANYFTKIFKKYNGVTPTNYKKVIT